MVDHAILFTFARIASPIVNSATIKIGISNPMPIFAPDFKAGGDGFRVPAANEFVLEENGLNDTEAEGTFVFDDLVVSKTALASTGIAGLIYGMTILVESS